uniref:CSON015372 protein n=1 Tax=Culicoides sonorensis TaxID=179676 RepID=A0A336LRZ9_CULSO
MTLNFKGKLYSEIMDICSDGGTMENCDEFREIQSILNTANDFVKDFSKIKFKGGNERYIKEISTRLGSYLKRAGLAQDSDKKLLVLNQEKIRQIVWLLMLNSKHEYMFSMEDDPNISHCLNTLPQLTPCLFLETLWNLNLDQFLYEIIAYSSSWLISPWLDDILESLRTMEAFILLERVQNLLKFVLIHIKMLTLNKKIDSNSKEKYYEKFTDFIAALLCHFNSPPGELEKWSSMKKHKYYGFSMLYLLNMSIDGLTKYGSQKMPDWNKTLYLFYKIKVDKKKLVVKTEHNTENDDKIDEICNILLNTLENMTMLIDSNIFIDWFEIDFPDPRHLDDEYTLQNMITHSAAELIEIQWKSVSFEHDVFNKLKSIQTPRESAEKFAKELKLGDLIEKLDNYKILEEKDALALFNEFISRGIIYNNEECLDTLMTCKSLIGYDQFEVIIKTVEMEEEIEEICQEKLGAILSDVIDSMKIEDLQKFLIRNASYFSKSYKNITFNCDIEEFCYDISNQSTKFLQIVVKQPKQSLEITSDMIKNTQKFHRDVQTQIIANYFIMLEMLPPIWPQVLNIFMRILNSVISQELPDTKGLVYFFTRLYKTSIISKESFIKDFVVQNIVQKNNESDTHRLMNASQILLSILNLDSNGLSEFLPMLLVGFGLVLDNLRENLARHGNSARALLDTVTTVVYKLVKSFQPIATKDAKSFIQQQLKSVQPLTQFYFQRLYMEKDQAPPQLEYFLHPNGFNSLQKRIITANFCEYLIKCTRKEILLLAKDDTNRHLFTDAMLVIVMTMPDQSFTLEFGLKNYSHIFQDMVNDDALPNESQLTLLKGVVNIICALPEAQKEVFAYGILSFLKKLIGKLLAGKPNMKTVIEKELLKTKISIMTPELLFQ